MAISSKENGVPCDESREMPRAKLLRLDDNRNSRIYNGDKARAVLLHGNHKRNEHSAMHKATALCCERVCGNMPFAAFKSPFFPLFACMCRDRTLDPLIRL